MKCILTNQGISAIQQAVRTKTRISVTGFAVGSQSNYTAMASQTQPLPIPLFGENSSFIKYWQPDNNSIAFLCYLDHTVGDFSIGNIMLYTGLGVPFAVGVLEYTDNKWADDIATTLIGNWIILTVGIRLSLINQIIDTSNLVEAVPTIITYTNELGLPIPRISEYNVANVDTINQYSNYNYPAAAYRVNCGVGLDPLWYGAPMELLSQISNSISGGSSGDNYFNPMSSTNIFVITNTGENVVTNTGQSVVV